VSNCGNGAAEGVYVYQHASYGGACWRLTGDSPDANQWAIGNNQLSSVRIVGPWYAHIFACFNYNATSSGCTYQRFTGSHAGYSWPGLPNDSASSAQVWRDADHDGHADGFDNCPSDHNTDQSDRDGDRVGDLCDSDSGTASDIDADVSHDVTSSAVYYGSMSAGSVPCRGVEIGYVRGRPRAIFKNALWAHLEWCYNREAVTSFKVVAVWPDTGTNCSPAWGPASWVRGGGVGQSSVDIVVRGSFSCGPVYKVGLVTRWRQTVIRLYASGEFQTFWEQ
jgi:hypothetical protein